MSKFATILTLMAIITVAPIAESLAQDSDSQTGLGLYAIGGSIHLVDPELIGKTIGIAAHADAGSPFAGFYLFPRLSYWRKSYGTGTSSFNISELGIGADLRDYIDPNANTAFYIGAGAGLFVTTAGYSGSYATASETTVGLSLLTGVETRISELLNLEAELRYKFDSNFNTLTASIGMAYDLTR